MMCVIRFFDVQRSYYCGRTQDGNVRKSLELRYAKQYEEDSVRLQDDILCIIQETGQLCKAYPVKEVKLNG